MVAYLRIESEGDIELYKATYDYELDSVGRFTASIPNSALSQNPIRYREAELFWDGQRIAKGLVNSVNPPDIAGKDENRIVCYDTFTQLAKLAKAKPTAHYQDELITDVIDDLLTWANGQGLAWALTDSSTMLDATQKITIDLRDKDTLFAQLAEVARNVESFHLRYGGYDDLLLQESLHVGAFGNLDQNYLQGRNLIKLRQNPNTKEIYKSIEPIGGDSGGVTVTLATTPTIALDPDFPISADGNGRYIVTNNNIGAGATTIKRFDSIKTDGSGTPTTTEQEQVANALYLAAVKFLKENSDYENYTLQAWVDSPPKLANQANIQGIIESPLHDGFTEQVNYYQNTFTVNRVQYVTSIKLDIAQQLENYDSYAEGGAVGFLATINTSDVDYLESTDPAIDLYKELS